jgi:hypothetical protein
MPAIVLSDCEFTSGECGSSARSAGHPRGLSGASLRDGTQLCRYLLCSREHSFMVGFVGNSATVHHAAALRCSQCGGIVECLGLGWLNVPAIPAPCLYWSSDSAFMGTLVSTFNLAAR